MSAVLDVEERPKLVTKEEKGQFKRESTWYAMRTKLAIQVIPVVTNTYGRIIDDNRAGRCVYPARLFVPDPSNARQHLRIFINECTDQMSKKNWELLKPFMQELIYGTKVSFEQQDPLGVNMFDVIFFPYQLVEKYPGASGIRVDNLYWRLSKSS